MIDDHHIWREVFGRLLAQDFHSLIKGMILTATIDKVPTGIPGLDEMMGGGIPISSSILISGETGTGKTTFCMQYLFKGAELGERGLYFIAINEPMEILLRHISTYEFADQSRFETLIRCVDLSRALETGGPDKILNVIASEVSVFKPGRVVIDSLPFLETFMKGDYKRFLFRLAALIKNWEGTTLITAESEPGVPYPLDIACISDGVILLYNMEAGSARQRLLEILKMMGTSHRQGKHAVDISSKGLIVFPGL